jgi:hypothetical protein
MRDQERAVATETGASGRLAIWPAFVVVVSLASLPYVTVLGQNLGDGIQVAHVLRWWGVTVGAAAGLVAVAAWRSRFAARWVGAVVGVFLYVFFSFRPIASWREQFGFEIADGIWWGIVAAVVLAVTIPLTRKQWAQLFLALASPALLSLPAVQLVTSAPAALADTGDEPRPVSGAFVDRPNIWYFVADGHAGADVLRERGGYDPTPFFEALGEDGFVVAERSRSNYPFTHLSIASALDMEYVYRGVEEPDSAPFFARLQGENRVVETLRSNGYGYVHAYPGFWNGSACGGDEDVCLGDRGPLSETEWALASMTPLLEVVEADRKSAASLANNNDPARVVPAVLASAPASPYFAFVHLLNPHPPFLYDAECQERDTPLKLSAWGDGPEYGEATECLHRRFEDAIDEILAVDPDAVIILQGDHGPRFDVDYREEGGDLLEEDLYFSILTAVRLPQSCPEVAVPQDLSPVNTFRLVFACLRGEVPDLLPYERFPIRREW